MPITNAVNNGQNTFMQNGKTIEAQTNMFSSTFFPVSSLTDFRTNTICKLDCFLANARSIVNKMSDLEQYVFEYNPDVMILESWAHDSISDVELNLSCFDLFRGDRLFSKGGGCM